ncbi:uncharacterized protein EV420DRAFT_892768 [Desarmillaria tabescens]|uniref:Heterokaryon incompatibility domain-containing protein n=1 Tax=Armillaria tabescens TaxID=1929756 RepID=A0AA39JTX7_ARMTA|nr:uncharacterized protein EV420DRAFT_892768 [Desarmillaria tabescens]KAK0446533.1 hypothetical protein EV420DRAFT_892768 [Desarmillaria tabescens]
MSLSVEVPNQWSYTGREPVIKSSLADTPCAALGIDGLLDKFNATLQTSYTRETPYLSSVLEYCISENYDFGTAYGCLRRMWYNNDWRTVEDELRSREKNDLEQRRKALVGNRIVDPHISPRRVWDLYSNRVVPSSWITDRWPWGISHAWVDEKDRVDVRTPINGHKWPVPIPKDTDLNLIRIEMLNLGAEYVWLDVLCLRQKGGPQEDLRTEEWKLDVPTIGRVYEAAEKVVYYFSGLGRPLILKEGDLDSDRCWFRRAWALQEIGEMKIVAGDTGDGPLHAEPIDKNGNYEREVLTRFHKQLRSLENISRDLSGIFDMLANMQCRISDNPVDKVAALAFSLQSTKMAAYYESQSIEEAWTAQVNVMDGLFRGQLFFLYPEPGEGSTKWRPSWKQVMMKKPLPAEDYCRAYVGQDEEAGNDWCKAGCIEKALVRGLEVGGEEGVDRWGELIVEDADGACHTVDLVATHQYSIPEDTYTLLCSEPNPFGYFPQYWVVGRMLPGRRFEKVSVAMTDRDEIRKLVNLGVAKSSHNVIYLM